MTRTAHFLLVPCSLLLVPALSACSGALDVGGKGSPAKSDGGAPDPSGGSSTTTAACIPLGPDVKVLVEKKGVEPESIALDGDTLYFSGRDISGPLSAPSAIYKVAVQGGTPEAVVTNDFVGGAINVDATRLVFTQGRTESTGTGVAYSYPNVLVRDKASGATLKLDNPPDKTYVEGVRLQAGVVYWESREYDAMAPSVFARWDETTKKTVPLADRVNAGSWVIDQQHLYFGRITGSTYTFERVPVAGGGAPEVIKTFAVSGSDYPELIAVDESHVWFSSVWNSGSLETMNKAGGGENVLVAPSGDYTHWLASDSAYFYGSPQGEQDALYRVSKATGERQLVSKAANEYVQSVAVDRCNVYFATVNPPRIKARGL